MPHSPPWYDSSWLGKYLAAKDLIARVAPAKTEAFVSAFDPLRTDPEFSLRRFERLIPSSELDELRRIAANIPRDRFEFHELDRFGRLIVHNHPEFASIHGKFAALVSQWAGETVEPAYNFFSTYTRRGVCEPHLDSPSAKWTLDICLGQSEPWPIQFSQVVPWPEERIALEDDWRAQLKSLDGVEYDSVTLRPGDAVLFSGSGQWHYREAIPGHSARSSCDLLFLHYIPAGTAELIETKNWARLFDVAEIASIPGIDEEELAALRRQAAAVSQR